MPKLERSLSASPRRTPHDDADMDVDKNNSPPHKPSNNDKSDMKVVIVTNLTRNVVESHLQTIFGFYGPIAKVDLPLFGKSGQNRGKAALEFVDASSAQQAASHMDGGQLDGAVLKVELSNLPIRTRSRSPRRGAPAPPLPTKNGRERDRFERGHSYSRSRSPSRSRTHSRSPVPVRNYRRSRERPVYGGRDSYRGRPFGRRGGGPGRDVYRPIRTSRSRSRSRSLPRRPSDRLGPRRRSPSYSRGGYGRVRGKSRSHSYSVRSSRSRSPSYSRSRSRTRSLSYSSYSRSSRSRSRSRSISRGRRSHSRDDIRDSRSRSPREP